LTRRRGTIRLTRGLLRPTTSLAILCIIARPKEEVLIRVALADNHQLLHAGIQTTLAPHKEIRLIGAATRERDLRQLCLNHHPDVVILALNVIDDPCQNMLHDLRKQCPTAKILILLHSSHELSLHHIMELGAAGSILKSDAPAKLIEAIRAVANGQSWFSPILTSQHLQSPTEGEGTDLTKREIEILQLVASGKIDKEIAPALGITARTVRYHLQNVNDKLETTTRTEAVAEAIRRRIIE
jgi:DNA-binding NarL/FixJ family response regulator